MSLQIVLRQIFDPLLGKDPLGGSVTITTLLDNSGSTAAEFEKGITVLQKSIKIAKSIALENRNGTNFLVTFHSYAQSRGRINITSNNTVMFPPDIRPEDSTFTDKGLNEILKELPSTKTTKIVLITDGQTNSSYTSLISVATELKKKNVDIEIIAVSPKRINFLELGVSEVKLLAGMDVVNTLNVPAKIYTPEYSDVPFELARSVDSSARVWELLGIQIPKNSIPLPILINMIINSLQNSEIDFLNPGIQEELQTLFIEMGMLIGLLNMTGSNCIAAFEEILRMLEVKTGAELFDFIQYGIQLKQSNEPFVVVNLQRRLIDYKEQRQTYQDATNNLQLNGTALGKESISFSNGIVIFITIPSSLTRNGNYSIDSAGNIFFTADSTVAQSTRQGLRAFFGDYERFKDSRSSPSVIFAVCIKIILYLLVDPDLTLSHEYIKKLRKIARIQIGQKIQNRDKSYGNSFEEEWKAGNLPQIHFSRQETHADLHTDSQINPLGLPQTLWWAVMMMIFGDGLFEAQMRFYKDILNAEVIEPTEKSLLEYLRGKYSSKVTGTVKFLTVDRKQSIITISDFPEGSTILENLPHLSSRGNECNTKTHYLEDELRQLEYKCPFCRERLDATQFKIVESFTTDDLRNHNPARFISQVQTSHESAQVASHSASAQVASHSASAHVVSAQVPSGGGSTVFSSRLHSNVSSGTTTSTKRKVQIHGNFGKGKTDYNSHAAAVKSAISSDSINANIMEKGCSQRAQFLRSAVQLFQSSSSNRTLSYVGGESDLVPKGDSYYFWGKILVGKIADIEVEYFTY